MLNNILEAMRKGPVILTFTSLRSGREIKDTYTLQKVDIPQNPSSDKIVAIHVPTGRYEDIQKDTIISWCLSPDHEDMNLRPEHLSNAQ